LEPRESAARAGMRLRRFGTAGIGLRPNRTFNAPDDDQLWESSGVFSFRRAGSARFLIAVFFQRFHRRAVMRRVQNDVLIEDVGAKFRESLGKDDRL